MKYTRLELHSSLSQNTIKNIVIFFILIPILAIGIGKIITSIIIVPYADKMIQPVQYAVNTENRNTADFYVLQAGVFINKENAEILQKGINNIYNNSYIINDEDTYRVIVDVSDEKKNIEDIDNRLRENGYNCIISNISFNSENKDAAYSENISVIINLLNMEKECITDVENSKGIGVEKIKNQKNKVIDILEKIKSENKSSVNYETISKNYKEIIDYSDEIIAKIQNRKIVEAKGCLGNQIYCFKSIYEKYTESL